MGIMVSGDFWFSWENKKDTPVYKEKLEKEVVGKVFEVGESTWWVKIKNSKGQEGWTDETDGFYMYNHCGGDTYEEWKAKVMKESGETKAEKNASLLDRKLYDQWKQVIQMPSPKRDLRELIALTITGKYEDYSALYLLGVNRRNLANDALISANKFLKKGDLKNAQKYADLATRHYIESNELFKAAEQVFSGSVAMTAQTLEAIYRGTKEASEYGWYLMCGPKCYEVADYVFLMTDFAVDYGLEGIDEAKKNLIANAFVKTLLKTSGISSWVEKRTTYLIGDSGLYNMMDKTINSPEFQKALMEVLAESGAYASKKLIETGAKTVIQNSLDFVKDSSNLTPGKID